MLPAFLEAGRIEAGCDEAGRGCLAGPVFAAAVILAPDFKHPQLNDSKTITEPMRLELREYILHHALAYGIARVDVPEIDRINILNASIKAMHLAVRKLKLQPQHLLIDGNRFKNYPEIPHTCIVQGDSKMASIAAASILAKTSRDEYMLKLHRKFPQYHWQQNKGYATLLHREAIRQSGPCIHHRTSFTLLKEETPSLFPDI